MRYTIFTNRNLDLHSRIIDLTQNLDDATNGLSITIWVVNNLNTHHLTEFGRSLTARRYQDIVPNALVLRSND